MDLNLIKKLRDEIYMLKLENKHLKMELEEVNSSWVHPNSCLHMGKTKNLTVSGSFIFSFVICFVVWGLNNAYPH